MGKKGKTEERKKEVEDEDGEGIKKNPEQIWACLLFLNPFQFSSPTSVFPFFPILIVEENVCNTLQ